MKNQRAPKVEVYCEFCKEWHYTDEVEFLDIEEDFEGRDKMTFLCKATNQESKSLVRKSPY